MIESPITHSSFSDLKARSKNKRMIIVYVFESVKSNDYLDPANLAGYEFCLYYSCFYIYI